MEKLVLYPTEMSQWHALVNEAQVARALQLNEDVESYLVFLLMRYCSQPKLSSSLLAMDFFDSCHAVGQVRQDLLRDVGDKSLLFSGLFPGLAQKRHVNISYFIEMGQGAYGMLSTCCEHSIAQLFASLCEGFISLMAVLHAMRDRSMSGELQLFSAEDYAAWKNSDSDKVLQTLQKQSDTLQKQTSSIGKKTH